MKPTVGRIVHYHNPKNRNGEPYAAIILAVADNVTLGVMTPEGGRFTVGMALADGPEGSDSPEYWVWPPRE
jgi:hypothetical protein